MILVQGTHISPTHRNYQECKELCISSRMLRNVCIYYIRQHYFATNTLYVEGINGKKEYLFNNVHLYHKFKEHECFRTDKHPDIGKKYPTKVLKQVMIQVNREFSSFYASIKDYHKNPSKYKGMPKIPSYTKEEYMTRFPKEALSFKEKGYIKLSMTGIRIPLGDITREQVKEVIIAPTGWGYNIQLCYDNEINVEPSVSYDEITRICGLDIGLNNLATLASNDPSVNSLIVNGCPLKSINQYYNKTRARLQSELPTGKKTSKRIKQLTSKRNAKIKDYLHNASSAIITHLLRNKIECLVVGSNKSWKQNINIGKRNNQNFVSIPFYQLKMMLKYKCEMFGIHYIEREESYTSKCSFIDMEDIKKHESYLGNRKTRGNFISSSGAVINADINGALNIARKQFGNDFFIHPELHTYTHIIKSSY